MSLNKIVICGGHFSPALAVMEKLRQKKRYSLYYIGRKQVLEGDNAQSLEYNTITKLDIPFYSIITGRLQRSFTLYTLPSLLKIPIGFLQSLYILVRIKPILVLSFGGYVALPISLAAWILKIPLITHEQTSILGLSNRIISKIAKIVCLSWERTKHIPFGVKTVLTGNPLRLDKETTKNSDLTAFGERDFPLIYITGGSLGARSINQVVGKIIPQLAKETRILHQCGTANNEKDFKQLLDLKNILPSISKKNYKVVKYIDPFKVGNVLKEALLVIGRAGANTVAEVANVGVPAILIPLPWAADDEQESNARILERIGLATVISQQDLTPDRLIKAITYMIQHIVDFKKNRNEAKRLFYTDAADRIVTEIETVLRDYS